MFKNDKAMKMFPLNNKISNMKTRKQEKIYVQHANTHRLQSFALFTQ